MVAPIETNNHARRLWHDRRSAASDALAQQAARDDGPIVPGRLGVDMGLCGASFLMAVPSTCARLRKRSRHRRHRHVNAAVMGMTMGTPHTLNQGETGRRQQDQRERKRDDTAPQAQQSRVFHAVPVHGGGVEQMRGAPVNREPPLAHAFVIE
ncbi:MAG: hypothetical protein Kow0032_08850 [Methyloligellaceae bacterium]